MDDAVRLPCFYVYQFFQVAPAELESILLKHPSVSDSAVIGIEDEKYGELPRAYVVLKDGQHASEADVQKFVESKDSNLNSNNFKQKKKYHLEKIIVFIV